MKNLETTTRYAFRLLIAAAVVCVAGCKQVLVDQVAPRDAADIVDALDRAGIPAFPSSVGSGLMRIEIDSDAEGRALLVLGREGLPKQSFSTLDKMFPGQGFIVSPFEQRVRLAYALNQELTRTISEIDNVVTARVHISLGDPDARSAAAQKATASVSVKMNNLSKAEEVVDKVRLIVANAVPSLSHRDVVVATFGLEADHPELDPVPAILPKSSRKPISHGSAWSSLNNFAISSLGFGCLLIAGGLVLRKRGRADA